MEYGVGGLEAIALRIIGNGAYEASPAVSANHDSMCFDYVARDDPRAEDATTHGRDFQETAYLTPSLTMVLYTGPGARLSRDRLPCDSPIEATTDTA